jgi:hypothetical protein
VCRRVVVVFVRAVLGCLRARACDRGLPDGRGDAVAVIQRFGEPSISTYIYTRSCWTASSRRTVRVP